MTVPRKSELPISRTPVHRKSHGEVPLPEGFGRHVRTTPLMPNPHFRYEIGEYFTNDHVNVGVVGIVEGQSTLKGYFYYNSTRDCGYEGDYVFY